MCPRVDEIWKDAKDRLRKAKDHLRKGEINRAKTEAQNAVASGQCATILLLRGREDDRRAGEAGFDARIFEDWEKCSRPEDYIAKAERHLKHFSDLSPQENRLPFE
jgi:hypothetical protein